MIFLCVGECVLMWLSDDGLCGLGALGVGVGVVNGILSGGVYCDVDGV